MPRSGPVGTFTLPGAQATQVPGTPIPSAVNNQGWQDVEQTFNTVQPLAYGGTNAGTAVGAADNLSPAFVNVASAATTNIGAASSPNVNITGTTGITAFDTFAAGARRRLVFTGILTLTHNATSLILPNGGANITTAAGDTAEIVSLGSGNWKVSSYQSTNYPFGKITSFTPTAVGLGVAGVGTYIVQTGTCARIGDIVYVTINIAWSAHTGSGGISIAGLPFSSASTTEWPLTVIPENLTYTGPSLSARINGGSNSVLLLNSGTASVPSVVPMDTAAKVTISGFYFV